MQTNRLQMESHHCQQPYYFSVFSQFSSAHVHLITSLWSGTVLTAFMTWSRLSVERTEFAIALKWYFHRFAILVSPEVPPTVRGKDSFLGLSTLISFQKSLHSPIWSFDSIDLEQSLSSFSLKNFISRLKASGALQFSSASEPLLGQPAIFQWLTASLFLAFNSFARSFHPART